MSAPPSPLPGHTLLDMTAASGKIKARFEELSRQGLRVLGVACPRAGRSRLHRQGKRRRHDLPGVSGLRGPPEGGCRGYDHKTPGSRGEPEGHHGRQRDRRRLHRATGGAGRLEGGDGRRPSDDERRGPRAEAGRCRDLCRDRAEPEGADHPRPQEGGQRRGLHGRRDQRCLGAARRRREHLRRERRGRGQGGRRHRSSGHAASTS